jgi:hypothetical protein
MACNNRMFTVIGAPSPTLPRAKTRKGGGGTKETPFLLPPLRVFARGRVGEGAKPTVSNVLLQAIGP